MDDFHYSTDREWDNAEAFETGSLHPERAWILTDRDVWHANPFYKGPKVRHPEDDYEGDDTPLPPAPPLPDYGDEEIPF